MRVVVWGGDTTAEENTVPGEIGAVPTPSQTGEGAKAATEKTSGVGAMSTPSGWGEIKEKEERACCLETASIRQLGPFPRKTL